MNFDKESKSTLGVGWGLWWKGGRGYAGKAEDIKGMANTNRPNPGFFLFSLSREGEG